VELLDVEVCSSFGVEAGAAVAGLSGAVVVDSVLAGPFGPAALLLLLRRAAHISTVEPPEKPHDGDAETGAHRNGTTALGQRCMQAHPE
jgi:hypothetical protein